MAASRLRITGGALRGVPITEPKGHRLRPTTGLVREAVFNILGDRVDGATVLDLYAGTGALGLEALSRGAASAVFVEAEAPACTAILESLARAKMASAGKVFRGRLPAALAQLSGTFTIVFMDPPYNEEKAEETLWELGAHVSPGGVVVYEHGSRYNPPERPAGLRLAERRVYGDSALAFYDRTDEEDQPPE
jgi:16S rRNA (guanine966-N2)-methyltransferase